ncbi:MAG TPA: FlgD immunoglobulin-like domain containing protein [Ignavibacteriaceae bacterium]|nr:FlgD immunoglobulin-like domain containing protein [Ignavibacteriaceae bacterium]
MKRGTILLFSALFLLFFSTDFFAQVIYSEDFESGTANAGWYYYPNPSTGLPEETVVAAPMSNAPSPLAGGGNFMGHLQDLDGSYTGSATALNGATSLANYSIEADVYCYVNEPLSAYTGLVVYADTTLKDFYKLRADFDANDRINFSGRRSDPNTFLPLFNKDFKGVDNPGLFPTVSGWHKMKIEVRNTSENETSFWCYFDGQLLAGCPIVDTTSNRNKSGSFGLYAFQQSSNGIPGYFDNIVVEELPTILYSEDFESGTANAGWYYYPNPSTGLPEETVVAAPMSNAPSPLAGGGNFMGHLQDLDGSYTGSATALNGATSLANYSIEADVYCYVNEPLSAYTGLVVYADTTLKDFYKLRADFDANDRINFSGRRSDPNTFLPLFNKDFKGVDNPGLFPTVSGWHKMKIEVRNTSENETSFWCYFDGQLLAGCPIVDTTSNRNKSGSFGLYAFQQSSNGIPGYFDNIVVKQLQSTTSVDEKYDYGIPEEFYLAQNYPNPFNPSTSIIYNIKEAGNTSLIIYDILGARVKTLVSQFQSAGQYNVTWDGLNDAGNQVRSGIYIYSLQTNNAVISKKMLLLK